MNYHLKATRESFLISATRESVLPYSEFRRVVSQASQTEKQLNYLPCSRYNSNKEDKTRPESHRVMISYSIHKQ